MIKSILFSFAATFLCSGVALAVQITEVSPGTYTGSSLITFDDVAGGTSPGTNYDGILDLIGASFAERFVGQALTHSGGDILSETLVNPDGTPVGTLALKVGEVSENLNVFYHGTTFSNVLDGLGKVSDGSPPEKAIGEGSIAVLFQSDQSMFGFDLVGGNAGSAFLSFFMRNGTLIDTISLNGLGDKSYYAEGTNIAGFSIYNTDPGGMAFDNLRFSGPANSVPEPSTFLLLGAGLIGSVLLRKRSRT